jgi:hypothetical protein
LGDKDTQNDIGNATVNFGSSDDDGMDDNSKKNEDDSHIDDINGESTEE